MADTASSRAAQVSQHLGDGSSGMSKPTIVLHALNNSRSQRILWLLEELEIPYEVVKHRRNSKTMLAPPELRDIHPLGKSPTIVIKDNGKETVLAESGAIVEYLVETYGKDKFLVPPGAGEDRMQYLHWIHFCEGTFMPFALFFIVFAQIGRQSPWLLKPIVNGISAQTKAAFFGPNMRRNIKYMDDHLQGKEYFVGGKLTGADFVLCYACESAEAMGDCPNIKRYLNGLRARPAWQRAEEKGE